MADDPLSNDEQLELACAVLDKNEGAAVRLLETYGPRVKYLLKHHFGPVLNEPDIQSCLHAAVMTAWTSPYDDSKGTLGGWFYTIAYHAAVDLLRGKKNAPRSAAPSEREPAIPPRVPACLQDDEKPDPAVFALTKAIESLGPLQRAIVKADLLADGEADAGLLAERLSIPKQHVYSYRNKARERLLALMEGQGHTTSSVGRRRR